MAESKIIRFKSKRIGECGIFSGFVVMAISIFVHPPLKWLPMAIVLHVTTVIITLIIAGIQWYKNKEIKDTLAVGMVLGAYEVIFITVSFLRVLDRLFQEPEVIPIGLAFVIFCIIFTYKQVL